MTLKMKNETEGLLACSKEINGKDMDILNGDHGIRKRLGLTEFIWTEDSEPHAARKKAMVKELGKQVTDLQGHEPLTKWIVIALFVTHVFVGYLIKDEALYGGTLKFWLVAYTVGATLSQALFLANHEISHNLAFRKQIHNKLFGIFTNGPSLIPYFISFKEYHNEHHKFQGEEGVDMDLPTELEARLMSSVPGKLFYMFNQTWFYAFRPVIVRPKPFTMWHALNVFYEIFFIFAIIRAWGWGPIFYFLASVHLAGSWHPLASHFIAEHYVFAGELETCSYYGILNYLTWNVGYHNEHHDFPNIPWSRLPKLREAGGKFYDSLPFHRSWVSALWNFLLDNRITMYNRVKREERVIKKSE